MIRRLVTKVTIECFSEAAGVAVWVTLRYIESDATSGRTMTSVERFEGLSERESRQLVEDISTGIWVGEDIEQDQMALFTLV